MFGLRIICVVVSEKLFGKKKLFSNVDAHNLMGNVHAQGTINARGTSILIVHYDALRQVS